ncbi:MAG: hypothetical protein HYW95_02635 [Candidatus Wildermuthbacteria bacterium]|nr:hypothetical protein [Candidatus Wildermuthbacteria bacterium]
MRISLFSLLSIIVIVTISINAFFLAFIPEHYSIFFATLLIFFNMSAGALVGFLLQRGIFTPLKRIQKSLDEIKKDNFDLQMPAPFAQELRDFVGSIQVLLQKIQQSKKETEEARAVLEIRVGARTRELRELADSLEGKIQERTKELQGRVKELERFQKLVVGRELWMRDLKRRNRELQARLRKETEEKFEEAKVGS